MGKLTNCVIFPNKYFFLMPSLDVLFLVRVHELFLYNDDLKKSKFSFGHYISHRNPVTDKHDMKVRCQFINLC